MWGVGGGEGCLHFSDVNKSRLSPPPTFRRKSSVNTDGGAPSFLNLAGSGIYSIEGEGGEGAQGFTSTAGAFHTSN